jgi:hypothetical protein
VTSSEHGAKRRRPWRAGGADRQIETIRPRIMEERNE